MEAITTKEDRQLEQLRYIEYLESRLREAELKLAKLRLELAQLENAGYVWK